MPNNKKTDPKAGAPTWKYQALLSHAGVDMTKVNELAAQGWHVVAFSGTVIIMGKPPTGP